MGREWFIFLALALLAHPVTAEEEKTETIEVGAVGIIVASILCVAIIVASVVLARLTRAPESDGRCGLVLPKSIGEGKRCFLTDLQQLELVADEEDVLDDQVPKAAAKYLAWRRTLLGVSAALYVVSLGLLLGQLAQGEAFKVNAEKDETSSTELQKREKARDQMLDMLPVVQHVAAIAFYSVAVWRWYDYPCSRLVTFVGYIVAFFTPFVYFTIPWMSITVPEESVRLLCHGLVQVLDGSLSDYEIVRTVGTEVQPATVTDLCDAGYENLSKVVSSSYFKLKSSASVSADVAGAVEAMSKIIFALLGPTLKYIIYYPFFVSAIQVLRKLVPGVLGLMFGMQGGLKICKLRFPAARVTAWMLVLLQGSSLPIVMSLMALLLVVVGTVPVMVTAVCYSVAMTLYVFRPSLLLEALTAAEAEQNMNKADWVSRVLKLVGTVMLVVGVYIAPHLMAFKEDGFDLVKNAISPLGIIRMVVQVMAGSMASKIIFCDLVVHVMISTYLGTLQDPIEPREATMAALTDIGALLPKYKSTKHSQDGPLSLTSLSPSSPPSPVKPRRNPIDEALPATSPDVP